MQETRSNELDSHVNFQMSNFKEYDADVFCFFFFAVLLAMFVTRVKKSFCCLACTSVKLR